MASPDKEISFNNIDEEINRVFLPANDCRRFNGTEVAAQEIQVLWSKPDDEPLPDYSGPVIIDRLRE